MKVSELPDEIDQGYTFPVSVRLTAEAGAIMKKLEAMGKTKAAVARFLIERGLKDLDFDQGVDSE